MSPDKKQEASPNTPETNRYWQEVVYPEWPWKNKKPQTIPFGNAVSPKNRKEIKSINQHELPTEIELSCGCFGSLFQDGTLLPHHIKGCHGEQKED